MKKEAYEEPVTVISELLVEDIIQTSTYDKNQIELPVVKFD